MFKLFGVCVSSSQPACLFCKSGQDEYSQESKVALASDVMDRRSSNSSL